MTHLAMLPLLIVVLVALANASNLLENGLIFEDIRIENIDASVSKKSRPLRTREAAILALDEPTISPTAAPTTSEEFSHEPTLEPTAEPTFEPTNAPTLTPSYFPSHEPTESPTFLPSFVPTFIPTQLPSVTPTYQPSVTPTYQPSFAPTFEPTFTPSAAPTTRAPTRSPTRSPSNTPAPTATFPPQPVVKAIISGSLGASNTNANEFNSDPNNALVLGYTIDTVAGVSRGSTAVGQAVDNAPTSRRRLSTSSVTIPYTITIPSVNNAGFANADDAFTAINNNLQTAVSTGEITTLMATIATEANVTISVSLNVTGVTPGALVVEEQSNHRRYVSNGEIAGIVIGAIVGVALLGVVIYYTLRMRRASLGETSSLAGDKAEVYRDLGADSLPAIENGPLATTGGAHVETSLVAASENDTRV